MKGKVDNQLLTQTINRRLVDKNGFNFIKLKGRAK